MSGDHPFPHLEDAAQRFGGEEELSLADLRDLLCRDCDFFHEDDLECSSFRILKSLLERGELSPAGLSAALGPR
jgi:hypothetical protein